MSAQVIRIRFPALSVAISVERPRRREGRPRASVPSEDALARLARHSRPIAETTPNLTKLQI